MTITTFQMVREWQNYIAHDVLKLFFECEEHNINTDETFVLLNEFLYPVYTKKAVRFGDE